MAGDAMIVAGIGCRRGCPGEAILALVQQAAAHHTITALAAPAFKREEPGLLQAAVALGLPLHWVDDAALAAAQPRCATRSAAVAQATGHASIAEAAALAASGGRLLLPRIAGGGATCAVAG